MLTMDLVLSPVLVQSADTNISGFASVISGMSLNDDTTYTPSPEFGKGFYGENFTLAPESRFGIQMNVPVNDKLTATMQIVGYGANNWEPTLPWAYVSYQASGDVQVRVGRMRRPLYLFSDYIDVWLCISLVKSSSRGLFRFR